ncbi:hypothetical protein Cni_G19756 [Canna indica]|uniref:Uncharacterized protein n=1 Tax=Canna indica TaxID=4628 RepID=A0AAQ3QK25_9LILI|nr:hypothetical protein Cni_G19756 [Canna indica]
MPPHSEGAPRERPAPLPPDKSSSLIANPSSDERPSLQQGKHSASPLSWAQLLRDDVSGYSQVCLNPTLQKIQNSTSDRVHFSSDQLRSWGHPWEASLIGKFFDSVSKEKVYASDVSKTPDPNVHDKCSTLISDLNMADSFSRSTSGSIHDSMKDLAPEPLCGQWVLVSRGRQNRRQSVEASQSEGNKGT